MKFVWLFFAMFVAFFGMSLGYWIATAISWLEHHDLLFQMALSTAAFLGGLYILNQSVRRVRNRRQTP